MPTIRGQHLFRSELLIVQLLLGGWRLFKGGIPFVGLQELGLGKDESHHEYKPEMTSGEI